MTKCAFIGLGVMGFPMAGHLAKAGLRVTVFNRNRAKADSWCAAYDGQKADSPRAAAQGADFVFTCVGNDDDLRAVVLGEDGVLAGLKPGAVLIDHTTTSAEVAREISAACLAQNNAMLDAPVSGGEAGAVNGALTVMVGGAPETFAKAEPILAHFARASKLLGPAGAGQLTKMVNQICIGGLVQGLAEGLNFAEKAGLDGRAVIETISKGAAQSWQMENRYETMIDGAYDFGFAVDWMVKDLTICLDEAARNGAPLPVTELVKSYYEELQTMDGGRWDTSSLLKRLQSL
ncbi:MAG: NAD(P)-dependent oxidoreductase [Rhodobiaceae bacterium]|jgi:3-hydroxyisobutyrate dehydrogenase-like beta-hydroxyacid dehydrogenase|nr:NAD(P)-dependent oxidoreductase [Rhodobiaceae bacterium]MBT7280327.1 NAD(P)-dependent oxidoreductase [Rhodobiaceae bacterium]MDG2494939.1 NAD(P)-dependent oxidoreductase [Alphaproteobacteria bacterium]